MKSFTLNNNASNPGMAGFIGNTNQQLPVVDWLADLPETQLETDLVEVLFKNTHKGYYLNSNKIPLCKGDVVAVEASPGHDIGTVILQGRLVIAQIRKNHINLDRYEVRRVYRKARPADIEKYEESKAKEHDTMIRARKIAADLKLEMKIGDVEYQGDGSKAIFYYIADGRVDFRQLIKVLAEVFHVRIEMKQIGARQEAGRIGGIGPCGRELCCTTWKSNFVTVTTSAARMQDISTNPLKLAGQCAKIKCCVNYELDAYAEAKHDFPPDSVPLETINGTFYHFKTDVFKREMSYSSARNSAANLVTLDVDRVKAIIAQNKQGIKVETLENQQPIAEQKIDFENVVGQDSLTRFDKAKKKRNKNRSKNRERQAENDKRSTTPNPPKTNSESPSQVNKHDSQQCSTENRQSSGNNGQHRDNRQRNRGTNRQQSNNIISEIRPQDEDKNENEVRPSKI